MGKVIMVMGTASGVGKSTVVLALCRILSKMGYRVAPFKAQNITSKVTVLPDDKKIATSTFLAAAACNLDPHPDMGPVLLAPSEDKGIKIILNGEDTESSNFDELRPRLFDQAFLAYQRLLQNYDVVVVEGAGSPVELNLTNQDIVNMNFATRANTPVLLVSEIHRGGVFASVYGTLELLSKSQRRLVKGVIINKFMGEPALFEEGKQILERITEMPVLGVLPFMPIDIEDEDSLTEGKPKTKESLYKDKGECYTAFVDSAIEGLANQVEAQLDMAVIANMINEGV